MEVSLPHAEKEGQIVWGGQNYKLPKVTKVFLLHQIVNKSQPKSKINRLL